ncbi:MAG: glycerol kinase GlpK [Castellaniella sp.]
MKYLLALDQGTSSTRSIVFDARGRLCSLAQNPLRQAYPQPGWVEHDPLEIWQAQIQTARQAMTQAGIHARDICALGITNQRETSLIWDRITGEPLHQAIVWQDRRTEPYCEALRAQGLEEDIIARTGLRIDAYFSATKLQWLLDHVDGARALAQAGRLAFGTVDSWLIWKLTGGGRHACDVSNASRTLLFNIHTGSWDADLLRAMDIPAQVLPEVLPSAAHYGDTAHGLFEAVIPITGVAGDQQSALFGQACFSPGMAKNTYGTGCFMLMPTGTRQQESQHGLLSTRCAQTDETTQFALEGSVFVGGAVVQWLRDGLHGVRESSEIEALARSVPDAGGVSFVPAFTGLGAPWWNTDARGTITGITRGTTMAHIARAALESIAFQSASVLDAMSRDARAAGAAALTELRVDGGASVNDFLMQFQADLLGIPVVRPAVVETTALGAAWLAGLAGGLYTDTRELTGLWREDRRFEPCMSHSDARARMDDWQHAVRKACAV